MDGWPNLDDPEFTYPGSRQISSCRMMVMVGAEAEGGRSEFLVTGTPQGIDELLVGVLVSVGAEVDTGQ